MSRTVSSQQERQIQQSMLRCREDKLHFAKTIMGVDFEGKQREGVTLGGQVSVKIAGRRFGKSLGTLVGDVLHDCLVNPRRTWYITGPSLDQANIYFDEIENFLDDPSRLFSLTVQPKHKNFRRSPFPEVEFINGSKIMGRSVAHDGKYLRGKGADGVVLTEAAFIKDRTYTDVIRAMVLDRKGKIRIETTPNGSQGYVYNLYQQGLDDPTGYYKSFHATVYDNPRLDREEIERIRSEIPDLAFRVEYLAEFVDDDTLVFPWAVLQHIFEDYEPKSVPHKDSIYSIGVDLAKYQDYTVITVLDTTRPPFMLAEWYRFRGRMYGEVVKLVNDLQQKYRAPVHLDATGVGDPIAEQIIDCRPFLFTQKAREELISNLVVHVEQRKLLLPSNNTEIRDELRFLQRVRKGINVRAEAPSGKHDDIVMSLALACWSARSASVPAMVW